MIYLFSKYGPILFIIGICLLQMIGGLIFEIRGFSLQVIDADGFTIEKLKPVTPQTHAKLAIAILIAGYVYLKLASLRSTRNDGTTKSQNENRKFNFKRLIPYSVIIALGIIIGYLIPNEKPDGFRITKSELSWLIEKKVNEALNENKKMPNKGLQENGSP